MTITSIQSLCKSPTFLPPPTFLGSPCFSRIPDPNPLSRNRESKFYTERRIGSKSRRGWGGIVCGVAFPIDPWAPSIDSQSIASQLFAASLFPNLGFLYFITKSKSAPKLTLFGFYLWGPPFLLEFMVCFRVREIEKSVHIILVSFMDQCLNVLWLWGGTAKVNYGTSLANVDWLHGGAEAFLTLTNICIVLGSRGALTKAGDAEERTSAPIPGLKEEKKTSV